MARRDGRRARRAAAGDRRRPLDRQPHACSRARPSSPSPARARRARFRAGGARRRRGPRGRRRRSARRRCRRTRRCSSCPTCWKRSPRWRRPRARARSARIVAVTGSVGKTSTKEALRLVLAASGRDARLGRLLQQPLGRAALARAHAGTSALRRVRDRHEPRRRDRAAHRGWCARTWRSSPRSSRCTWSTSARSKRSPTPRPRSSPASSPAAPP